MGDPLPDPKDYNLPVTNLTWWAAVLYANKLSKKEGLTPAYDLTEVEFEQGTSLKLTVVKEALLKANAPNNDIYQAQGYRLPTKNEYLFLITNRAQSAVDFFSQDSKEHKEDYVWCAENSGGILHPVADRQPFVIDDNPFYDLFGHVQLLLDEPMPTSKKGRGESRQNGGYSIHYPCEVITTATPTRAGQDDAYGRELSFFLVRSLPK